MHILEEPGDATANAAGKELLTFVVLVVFALSLACDGIGLLTAETIWGELGYWDLLSGCAIGSVLGAVALVDLHRAPVELHATSIAFVRAVSHLGALSALVPEALVRAMDRMAGAAPSTHAPSGLSVALSVVGLALTAVGAWLGGELADRSAGGPPPVRDSGS